MRWPIPLSNVDPWVVPGVSFKPIQALALGVLSRMSAPDGLVVAAGVGHGKTLIGLFAGDVVGAKRPVFMTRPKLVPQVEAELKKWRPKVPPKVVGYGALSSISRGEDLLDVLAPDLLILDEAHELGNIKSARVRRVDRYLRKNQDTRVVVMTGTLTRNTLLDHVHLLTWALPRSCFSDLSWPLITMWDSVLSPQGEPDQASLNSIQPLLQWSGETEPRRAYHKLLSSTPGVILTQEDSADVGLQLHPWTVPLPTGLKRAFQLLDSWELPNGEAIIEASEYARSHSTLSVGFYYDRPPPSIKAAEARSAWAYVLKRHLHRPYNSEGLVARAAEDNALGFDARVAWDAWQKVRGSWPIGQPCWLSNDILHEAIAWAKGQDKPSIIWTSTAPTLEAFKEMGIPVFGAGSAIPKANKAPIAVVSTRVHGTGSNLQAYPRALILEPPTSGASWEQLLGRHHRPGSLEDVDIWIYTRPWNLLSSLQQAGYLKGVLNSEQKIFKYAGQHKNSCI